MAPELYIRGKPRSSTGGPWWCENAIYWDCTVLRTVRIRFIGWKAVPNTGVTNVHLQPPTNLIQYPVAEIQPSPHHNKNSRSISASIHWRDLAHAPQRTTTLSKICVGQWTFSAPASLSAPRDTPVLIEATHTAHNTKTCAFTAHVRVYV